MTAAIIELTHTIQRAFAPKQASAPLDWSKPLRTVSGRPAILVGYAKDNLIVKGQTHAVFVFAEDTGAWELESYFANGRFLANEESGLDLINVALLDGTPLTGDHA